MRPTLKMVVPPMYHRKLKSPSLISPRLSRSQLMGVMLGVSCVLMGHWASNNIATIDADEVYVDSPDDLPKKRVLRPSYDYAQAHLGVNGSQTLSIASAVQDIADPQLLAQRPSLSQTLYAMDKQASGRRSAHAVSLLSDELDAYKTYSKALAAADTKMSLNRDSLLEMSNRYGHGRNMLARTKGSSASSYGHAAHAAARDAAAARAMSSALALEGTAAQRRSVAMASTDALDASYTANAVNAADVAYVSASQGRLADASASQGLLADATSLKRPARASKHLSQAHTAHARLTDVTQDKSLAADARDAWGLVGKDVVSGATSNRQMNAPHGSYAYGRAAKLASANSLVVSDARAATLNAQALTASARADSGQRLNAQGERELGTEIGATATALGSYQNDGRGTAAQGSIAERAYAASNASSTANAAMASPYAHMTDSEHRDYAHTAYAESADRTAGTASGGRTHNAVDVASAANGAAHGGYARVAGGAVFETDAYASDDVPSVARETALASGYGSAARASEVSAQRDDRLARYGSVAGAGAGMSIGEAVADSKDPLFAQNIAALDRRVGRDRDRDRAFESSSSFRLNKRDFIAKLPANVSAAQNAHAHAHGYVGAASRLAGSTDLTAERGAHVLLNAVDELADYATALVQGTRYLERTEAYMAMRGMFESIGLVERVEPYADYGEGSMLAQAHPKTIGEADTKGHDKTSLDVAARGLDSDLGNGVAGSVIAALGHSDGDKAAHLIARDEHGSNQVTEHDPDEVSGLATHAGDEGPALAAQTTHAASDALRTAAVACNASMTHMADAVLKPTFFEHGNVLPREEFADEGISPRSVVMAKSSDVVGGDRAYMGTRHGRTVGVSHDDRSKGDRAMSVHKVVYSAGHESMDSYFHGHDARSVLGAGAATSLRDGSGTSDKSGSSNSSSSWVDRVSKLTLVNTAHAATLDGEIEAMRARAHAYGGYGDGAYGHVGYGYDHESYTVPLTGYDGHGSEDEDYAAPHMVHGYRAVRDRQLAAEDVDMNKGTMDKDSTMIRTNTMLSKHLGKGAEKGTARAKASQAMARDKRAMSSRVFASHSKAGYGYYTSAEPQHSGLMEEAYKVGYYAAHRDSSTASAEPMEAGAAWDKGLYEVWAKARAAAVEAFGPMALNKAARGHVGLGAGADDEAVIGFRKAIVSFEEVDREDSSGDDDVLDVYSSPFDDNYQLTKAFDETFGYEVLQDSYAEGGFKGDGISDVIEIEAVDTAHDATSAQASAHRGHASNGVTGMSNSTLAANPTTLAMGTGTWTAVETTSAVNGASIRNEALASASVAVGAYGQGASFCIQAAIDAHRASLERVGGTCEAMGGKGSSQRAGASTACSRGVVRVATNVTSAAGCDALEVLLGSSAKGAGGHYGHLGNGAKGAEDIESRFEDGAKSYTNMVTNTASGSLGRDGSIGVYGDGLDGADLSEDGHAAVESVGGGMRAQYAALLGTAAHGVNGRFAVVANDESEAMAEAGLDAYTGIGSTRAQYPAQANANASTHGAVMTMTMTEDTDMAKGLGTDKCIKAFEAGTRETALGYGDDDYLADAKTKSSTMTNALKALAVAAVLSTAPSTAQADVLYQSVGRGVAVDVANGAAYAGGAYGAADRAWHGTKAGSSTAAYAARSYREYVGESRALVSKVSAVDIGALGSMLGSLTNSSNGLGGIGHGHRVTSENGIVGGGFMGHSGSITDTISSSSSNSSFSGVSVSGEQGVFGADDEEYGNVYDLDDPHAQKSKPTASATHAKIHARSGSHTVSKVGASAAYENGQAVRGGSALEASSASNQSPSSGHETGDGYREAAKTGTKGGAESNTHARAKGKAAAGTASSSNVKVRARGASSTPSTTAQSLSSYEQVVSSKASGVSADARDRANAVSQSSTTSKTRASAHAQKTKSQAKTGANAMGQTSSVDSYSRGLVGCDASDARRSQGGYADVGSADNGPYALDGESGCTPSERREIPCDNNAAPAKDPRDSAQQSNPFYGGYGAYGSPFGYGQSDGSLGDTMRDVTEMVDRFDRMMNNHF